MSKVVIGGAGIITIVFSILAYFAYGKSIDALLGMFLLAIMSAWTTVLAMLFLIELLHRW